MGFIVVCKRCNSVLRVTSGPCARGSPGKALTLYDGLPEKCPKCGHKLIVPPEPEGIEVKVVEKKNKNE